MQSQSSAVDLHARLVRRVSKNRSGVHGSRDSALNRTTIHRTLVRDEFRLSGCTRAQLVHRACSRHRPVLRGALLVSRTRALFRVRGYSRMQERVWRRYRTLQRRLLAIVRRCREVGYVQQQLRHGHANVRQRCLEHV